MEKINQAIERAKETRSTASQSNTSAYSTVVQPQFRSDGFSVDASQVWGKPVNLNDAHLEANRIIAHDITSFHARSFDMLRTQVLQSMELKGWQTIGVTSPTEACGKTVTSINLALSIARQQGRSVLLVDADIQRPRVADYLGIKSKQGILSVLEGRTDLQSALIQARINNQKMLVLPCEAASLDSSEWMASQAMVNLLQDIRRDFKGWTVIFDLPPVLAGDDVISILPQIDCALFVVGAGSTTISEIKESTKHLEATAVVRVVLNKSAELPANYYSRYALAARR